MERLNLNLNQRARHKPEVSWANKPLEAAALACHGRNRPSDAKAAPLGFVRAATLNT